MSKVRVWGRNEEWLWPNVPFLLRPHGQERIQRYGGVDPRKGVDNDFAAVLIRPLSAETGEGIRPLVSTEWHPLDVKDPDRRSVVHFARSDEFEVRISASMASGTLGVWLIYADFLEATVPRSWPRQGEYDGGILAYTEVAWERSSKGEFDFKLEHQVPPSDTGFDWEAWSTGDEALKKNLVLRVEN